MGLVSGVDSMNLVHSSIDKCRIPDDVLFSLNFAISLVGFLSIYPFLTAKLQKADK